jgi:hypothetical protein
MFLLDKLISAPGIQFIVILGSFAIIIFGIYKLFKRLAAKEQGFGPASLKALGLIIFVPMLMIMTVISGFEPETVAALLGTVAGYILSSDKAD